MRNGEALSNQHRITTSAPGVRPGTRPGISFDRRDTFLLHDKKVSKEACPRRRHPNGCAAPPRPCPRPGVSVDGLPSLRTIQPAGF